MISSETPPSLPGAQLKSALFESESAPAVRAIEVLAEDANDAAVSKVADELSQRQNRQVVEDEARRGQ